jgi:collagenase-like PrtC family protease
MDAYCNLGCREQQIKEKFEIISSQWIRPEDTGYYEEIGINKLQLLGSNMDKNGIIKVIQAYSRRSYSGNLAELFPGKNTLKPDIFINNCALDKFINYFLEERCLGLCAECGYCKDTANKAVQTERIENRLSSWY